MVPRCWLYPDSTVWHFCRKCQPKLALWYCKNIKFKKSTLRSLSHMTYSKNFLSPIQNILKEFESNTHSENEAWLKTISWHCIIICGKNDVVLWKREEEAKQWWRRIRHDTIWLYICLHTSEIIMNFCSILKVRCKLLWHLKKKKKLIWIYKTTWSSLGDLIFQTFWFSTYIHFTKHTSIENFDLYKIIFYNELSSVWE